MSDLTTEVLIMRSLELTRDMPGEPAEVEALLTQLNEICAKHPVHRVISTIYLMLQGLKLSAEQKRADAENPN